MAYNSDEWRLLNGYADGELPEIQARAFEQRLAAQPDLQRDLEELRDLKRKLGSMVPAPAVKNPPVNQAYRRPRTRLAIAATVAAIAILSTAIAMLRGEPTTWIEHAHALHAAQSQRAYVVEERHVVQTVSSGHTLEFRAPDLTASRLYLVDIATSNWEGREAIALHYRGLRGCRLTIVAIETGGDVDTVPAAATDDSHAWQYDGFAFTVIAEGMDANRFASVADFAQAAIVAPVEDQKLRTAMAETQQFARSCA
jgi:anti-sigma factor RsiW